MAQIVLPRTPVRIDETLAGISVQVFPKFVDTDGNPQRPAVEIQRAKDSTGTPGSPSTVAGDRDVIFRNLGNRIHTADFMALGTGRMHYRARHYDNDGDFSEYTGWVNAKPEVFIAADTPLAQVGSIFEDTLMGSDTTGVTAKRLRVGVHDWFPREDGLGFSMSIGSGGIYLTGNTSYRGYAVPTIPPGAEVYRVDARMYRGNTSDISEVRLWWVEEDFTTGAVPGSGIQATLTHSGSAASWQTVGSTTFSPVVHSGTAGAQVVLDVKLNQATGGSPRITWCDLYYKVSTVGQSV